MGDTWLLLDAALDRSLAAARPIELWLRDDDAVTTTPALDRLTALARRVALPVLLAVIPGRAVRDLAHFVNHEPLLMPTQHGFMHTNHAEPPRRAAELGADRPRDRVLSDLVHGQGSMETLFGSRRADILVPPWNRIAPDLLPSLPDLGFGGLSTFGDLHVGTPGLDILNCGLDIIDWRHGRVCHEADKLVGRLAALVDAEAPIGLLTHHLVHDEAAWLFLERALTRLAARPNVRFTAADQLRRRGAAGSTRCAHSQNNKHAATQA